MKKGLFLILILLIPYAIFSQEKDKKIKVGVSGFLRSDVIFNSRQAVSTRGESMLYLLPADVKKDAEGNDINAAPNFNMSSLSSRVRLKMSGAEFLGAKTSGLLEADFMGSAKAYAFNLRLRHAMVKMAWKTRTLIVGQYWHPLFVPDCLPGSVSYGAQTTFNPLARSPQLRLTQKVNNFYFLGAIMSHGMFKTKAGKQALQNGLIPEAHFQVQFKNDRVSTGLGINFQSIRPELVSANNYITKERVNSLSYFGYLKVKTKPIVAKVYALYGQNNDNLIMLGGYAVRDMNYSAEDTLKGFVKYAAYNVLSSWLDLETTGKKMKFGLFAGYVQNLGASEKVDVSQFTGRWHNVNSMMRIAPRVKFIVNKFVLGAELEYSSVAYARQEVDANGNPVVGSDIGGINDKGKVTNSESVNNIKFLLSLMYKF